jgi:hypothetical protein
MPQFLFIVAVRFKWGIFCCFSENIKIQHLPAMPKRAPALPKASHNRSAFSWHAAILHLFRKGIRGTVKKALFLDAGRKSALEQTPFTFVLTVNPYVNLDTVGEGGYSFELQFVGYPMLRRRWFVNEFE